MQRGTRWELILKKAVMACLDVGLLISAVAWINWGKPRRVSGQLVTKWDSNSLLPKWKFIKNKVGLLYKHSSSVWRIKSSAGLHLVGVSSSNTTTTNNNNNSNNTNRCVHTDVNLNCQVSVIQSAFIINRTHSFVQFPYCCRYYYYYYYVLLSQVSFSMALLFLSQWLTPRLKIEVSECSTFLMACDVPRMSAFFCRQSTACCRGVVSSYHHHQRHYRYHHFAFS
jgi:hypothetical protein